MNDHLSEESINDLVDGVLPRDVATAAEAHLDACPACRESAARLRLLAASVGALPRSVMPARDIWPSLRAELARRGAPANAADVRAWRRRPFPRYRAALAAAAVVLCVVSLALMRHRTAGRDPLVARAGPAPAVSLLPAALMSVERDYQRAAAELRSALDAQRTALAPETIARVERSLDVIDHAIAEARDALMQDPGNQVLADMLSATYGRKLDLLRRATELPPRT
jgi:anti-sigma factor RsiW